MAPTSAGNEQRTEAASGSVASPSASDSGAVVGQVVLVASGNGAIVHVLQAPAGYDEAAVQALVGTSIDELWPSDDAGQLARHAKRSIRSRQVESLELRLASGDGHYDFIFIPNGPDRVMLVGRDVSERKQDQFRLEKLAYFDDKTDLPNLKLLLEELRGCAETLRLTEGRAAVISFGITTTELPITRISSHQQDLIFRELAARLTTGLHSVDDGYTGEQENYSLAARTDYSQFGVLLADIDSGMAAEEVAERLIETFKEPIEIYGRNIRVGAHAGIALFPQDGRDADTLYGNALAAMEDAANSKVDYKLHSGTLRLRALQRQDIEAQLRTALEHGAFSVEYLPVVAADTRRVVSVEALLRWPQNVFNSLSIGDVVSVAENTGLILPIGDFVLRQSCRSLKEWHTAGWPDLRLSVNLSAQEFSSEETAKRIADILAENEIDAGFVDAEINEYSLFRDALRNYPRCSALKELGVGIAVDDYGTGACSLLHLTRSPVEAVKIDRSFVTHLGERESDRQACSGIIALAHKLGLQTIAEGVETEQQAEFLLDQGCSFLQGFLTCLPTPAEGVPEILAKGQPS
ncbi:MAG: EAL domain-containing protein [Pseudomonadota bacterium]